MEDIEKLETLQRSNAGNESAKSGTLPTVETKFKSKITSGNDKSKTKVCFKDGEIYYPREIYRLAS